MNNKLLIKNITTKIGDTKILNDINLSFETGDVVAILGPNGAGKSTLLKTIMHHFSTNVESGDIFYNDKKIDNLEPNEIAKLGFFYTMQNPIELDGVQMLEFLKLISTSTAGVERLTFYELYKKIDKSMDELKLEKDLLKRNVNVGFSGGQKKKTEILQAKLCNAEVLLLDEIDSGLDIDATENIAQYVNEESKNRITLVISHNPQFFKYINPNKTIILVDGNLVDVGSQELLKEIEKNGYKKYERKQREFILEDVYKPNEKSTAK